MEITKGTKIQFTETKQIWTIKGELGDEYQVFVKDSVCRSSHPKQWVEGMIREGKAKVI